MGGLERALQEHLHIERLSKEEAWQAQKSGQRLKPSSYLLQQRTIEKALAKSRHYGEAARVQREADRQEKLEIARHESELNEKVRKLDANLRQQEQAALVNLQSSLRE